MTIRELGYVILEATDIELWRSFATQILGMSVSAGPGGSLLLKMDERNFRFAIIPGKIDRLFANGWGVATKEDFDNLRTRLQTEGIKVHAGSPEEIEARMVQDLFWITDPENARHEVFWGHIGSFHPFVSPIGVSGFVTRDLGLGHVVLPAMNFEKTQKFWTENMGFGLSDILHLPLEPGSRARFYFLHCANGRQHSLALGELPSKTGCHHIMIEVASFDDVGFAMDRVKEGKHPFLMTLGRHVNDEMISFYFLGPGGIFFEIGWGGVIKNWDQHTVFETTRGSFWGHEFVGQDLV